MSDSANPYRPPPVAAEPPGWWARFRAQWLRPRYRSEPQFARGETIIYEGLAFWIEPQDREDVLYAASPSGDTSDARMDLIIREVAVILPEMLTEFPWLLRRVRGRRLVVTVIADYQRRQTDGYPSVDLGYRPLERMVAGPSHPDAGGD